MPSTLNWKGRLQQHARHLELAKVLRAWKATLPSLCRGRLGSAPPTLVQVQSKLSGVGTEVGLWPVDSKTLILSRPGNNLLKLSVNQAGDQVHWMPCVQDCCVILVSLGEIWLCFCTVLMMHEVMHVLNKGMKTGIPKRKWITGQPHAKVQKCMNASIACLYMTSLPCDAAVQTEGRTCMRLFFATLELIKVRNKPFWCSFFFFTK